MGAGMKIKETLTDWLKVLLLLLDEAVVLVAIFLALNYFGVKFTMPVTVLLIVVIATVVLIIHIKVIPSFHWKKVTGPEAMVATASAFPSWRAGPGPTDG